VKRECWPLSSSEVVPFSTLSYLYKLSLSKVDHPNFSIGWSGGFLESSWGYSVATSRADKAMEYANYAMHCLEVVGQIRDRDSRVIHREMAAEWFKLADQAAGEHAPLIGAKSYAGKRASHD
jgi:hypothetical protein